jgi:hypothetical protein
MPPQPSTEAAHAKRRRSLLVLALADLALIFAVVGAFGPAEHLRTRYSWPPSDLPATQPERLWYTPLLIARHEPESISARLPCRLSQPLRRADRPVTLLATAREPTTTGGLAVTEAGQGLLVSIGDRTVDRLELDSGTPTGEDCTYHLLLSGDRWSIGGGPDEISRAGSLEAMPRVQGLFSGLDLRSETAPSVEVTTTVHGTRTTVRQTIAWTAAALAALIALLLVAVNGFSRRPWAIAASAARQVVAQARPVDALIAVVLLTWWPIGPVFYDDGWVLARQRNFSESGGFSAYYSSFGVNLPLDYWLEWVEHWLFQSSSAVVVLRLPALLCLGATWILCRWTLRRTLASSVGEDRVAVWALGSAYAVGALAWGMTLRPEPVVALLVAGVLACTVRFLERQTVAPLAVAAVLVVLALSAHPAGIVAFAPLLVAAPRLARWARSRLSVAAAIAVASLALLITFATVGSDLGQRRADAVSLRTYGDETAGWRDELSRYSQLSQAPYGAGLRRESVALIVLAVLAYLLRRRRDRQSALLDLPATALGVALVLFLATPTKWPWHFGALIALAAVAVGSETARLREDARNSRGWQARPYLVIAAAMLAAAWSWFPRLDWNELDLRTLEWTLGIESRLTLAKVGGAIPLVLLVVLVAVELGRRRGRNAREVPWRVAALTAPILAIPLIAFTVCVLVADAAKTNAWTLARQNLKTLVGDPRCGLANNSFVAAPASMRALPTIARGAVVADSDSLPPAPAEGLSRFTLGPPAARSVPARSPWFSLREEPFGFFLGGIPGPSDTLELEWGRAAAGSVETLDVDEISADFQSDAEPELVPWRFYPAGSLPSPPREADAVRFLLHSDVAPGSTVALTPPVTYRNRRLAEVLESGGPPLVIPNLVMYVPCARQPRLSSGVAEVPGLILGLRHSIWPIATGTSPFDGVPELYPLTRLPLTDSAEPPQDVVVYRVDRRIPGAVEAPPDATTVIS